MPQSRARHTPIRFDDHARMSATRWRTDEIDLALTDMGSGVLYAVPLHGLVKIGFTTNLRNRVAQYGVPMSHLMLVMSGDREAEREIHRRFSAHVQRGKEWYRPHIEILDWINEQRQSIGWPLLTWELPAI